MNERTRLTSSLLVTAALLTCTHPCPGQSSFRRGDSNLDAALDVSDAIHLLGYLFLGNPTSLGCEDAADANDSGAVDLSDAVHELSVLFSGGVSLPPPGLSCGVDPTGDQLGCDSYPSCSLCDDRVLPPEESCPGDVFVPDSPVEDWQRLTTPITIVSSGPAHHRALDTVVSAGDEQILIGKFAYGPQDRNLTGEIVEVWVRVACGQWVKLGSTVTSDSGEHAPVQGVQDDGGRIFFTIPAAKRLGEGTYPVKMLVKGDHSQASCRLHVWPAGESVVVADVDGALTTAEAPGAWEPFDALAPAARPATPETLQAYRSKGFRIIYLTARPERLTADSRAWLESHGFPAGVVRLSLRDSNEATPESIVERGAYLAGLVTRVGITFQVAYGTSGSDRAAYIAGGVPAGSIALQGFDGDPQGVRVFESWTEESNTVVCLPLRG